MASSSRSKKSKRLAELDDTSRQAIGQRLLRCRIRLALRKPFLASALMRLPVRETYQVSWCKTAATDGYHIFFNPQWINELSDKEIRGVLAHEILHVLFTHSERRSDREPLMWNYACDFAINALLIAQGFKLPEGGLYYPKFSGMTSEQIYEVLKSKPAMQAFVNSIARNSGPDDAEADLIPDIGDDVLDTDDPRIRPYKSPDAPDAQQLNELREELRHEAMEKLKGDSSSNFRTETREEEKRRIDWRALLRIWLSDRIKGDWSSYPFAKKHIHRGVFMPSLNMAVPAHVVFAVDTSGSMDDAVIARIYGEIRHFREVFPCRLSVVQIDTQVRHVTEFDAMDSLQSWASLNVHGRGGTDFRPAFEWVDKNAPGSVILYATDGYGAFPKGKVSSPVIWLLTDRNFDRKKVPFGETLYACES